MRIIPSIFQRVRAPRGPSEVCRQADGMRFVPEGTLGGQDRPGYRQLHSAKAAPSSQAAYIL